VVCFCCLMTPKGLRRCVEWRGFGHEGAKACCRQWRFVYVCACSLSLTKKFRRVITAAAATGPFSHVPICVYMYTHIQPPGYNVCMYIHIARFPCACVMSVSLYLCTRIILYICICIYTYSVMMQWLDA